MSPFRVNTQGLGTKAAPPSPVANSLKQFAASANVFSSTFNKVAALLSQTAANQQRQKLFAQAQAQGQINPAQALANLFGFGGGGRIGNFLTQAGGTLSGIGGKVGGGLGGLLGKAGGALGSATAGPVGVALAAAEALTPVIKKLASAPFAAISTGMAVVNKALAGLTGTLGPIGSSLGILQDIGSGMKSLGDSLGPLGIGLSVMGGAIEGITKQVQAFLETAVALANKASPGTVRRFTIAVEDTAAVIGHRLVPVVELMRQVVRGIGDVLQTVLPHPNDIRAALAPLSNAFNDLKTAIAPIAHLLRDSLVVGLHLMADQLRIAAFALKVMLEPLAAFSRLVGAQLQSSVGAAARSAHYTTPEEYARQVDIAALTSEGVTPAQRTANNTDAMVDLLRSIRDALNNAVPGNPGEGGWRDFARGWLRGALGVG